MLMDFVEEIGSIPGFVGLASEHDFVLTFVLIFVAEFVDFEHVVF